MQTPCSALPSALPFRFPSKPPPLQPLLENQNSDSKVARNRAADGGVSHFRFAENEKPRQKHIKYNITAEREKPCLKSRSTTRHERHESTRPRLRVQPTTKTTTTITTATKANAAATRTLQWKKKKKKKCDVIPHVTRAPARVGLLQAAAWGECTRQVGEASRAATHKNKKPRGGAARAPAESARRPRHWDRWSRRLRSGGELCSASDRLTGGKKSGESRRTTSAMEAPFHEDDI